MSDRRASWSRREFIGALTLAGTAGPLAMGSEDAVAEPPPETKRLTLARTTSMCHAPQDIAEAFLEQEGFTDVHYLNDAGGGVEANAIASGEAQITLTFAGPLLLRIDAGDPVLLLAGGHVGCLELFGHDSVRAVRDLKGKRVLVYARESAPHVFLASVMAFVGLDHRKDVTIVTRPPAEALQTFAERQVDAFIASPPIAQELRPKQSGTSSSTARRIARGPSISAASLPATVTSFGSIPWRRSGRCAQSSSRPMSAPLIPPGRRGHWSTAASRRATTTRCRR